MFQICHQLKICPIICMWDLYHGWWWYCAIWHNMIIIYDILCVLAYKRLFTWKGALDYNKYTLKWQNCNFWKSSEFLICYNYNNTIIYLKMPYRYDQYLACQKVCICVIGIAVDFHRQQQVIMNIYSPYWVVKYWTFQPALEREKEI